jgi:hypothetical protein
LSFLNLAIAGLLAASLLPPVVMAADEASFPPFANLILRIPTGPPQPLTGSQFVAAISNLDERQREKIILKELLDGNLPAFLKHLVPVKLTFQPSYGRQLTATIFVMPEYLAIGTDADFLRIPMNLYTAAAAASHMGFVLPTRKIVNAVYSQSAFHFSPEPMTAGPQMRSTRYYETHNEKIDAQFHSLGVKLGALVAGHKKDVVITNLLATNPGRIAIYGWHRLTGAPIQPLSLVHGACYADYSHGIRLVSETVLIDGNPMSIYDVLRDPILSKVLSDEGPIPNLKELLVKNSVNTCSAS